jgi:serine O-acetyltransferase
MRRSAAGRQGNRRRAAAARDHWRAAQQRNREFAVREFPSRDALREIADALCGVLFPMRLGPAELHQEGEDFYVGHTLDTALNALFHQVQLELGYSLRSNARRRRASRAGGRNRPRLRAAVAGLAPPARQRRRGGLPGRPAARSVDEVLLCYTRASWR